MRNETGRIDSKGQTLGSVATELMRKALSLSESEREEILLGLAVPLDGQPTQTGEVGLSAAWRTEFRARRDALRLGTVVATPWETALANIFSDPD